MNLGMLGSDIDPEKTAFVSLPQNRRYTYGDIQSISDTVAAGLSRKYQVGDRIAVIGLNSADYIATVLGIMKAGMVAVPVNWKLLGDLCFWIYLYMAVKEKPLEKEALL